MSAGNPNTSVDVKPNVDNNSVFNVLEVENLQYMNMKRLNHVIIADNVLIDDDGVYIDEVPPCEEKSIVVIDYVDTFLTLYYPHNNKFCIRMYVKVDSAYERREYKIDLVVGLTYTIQYDNKIYFLFNHHPTLNNSVVGYIFDHNTEEGFSKPYHLLGLFVDKHPFGSSAPNLTGTPLINNRPIFITQDTKNSFTYIYDSSFNLIHSMKSTRCCDMIVTKNSIILSNIESPWVRDACTRYEKSIKLSYKPANYKKLCIVCYAPKSKKYILSCGHRSHCEVCVLDVDYCGYCKTTIKVIPLGSDL